MPIFVVDNGSRFVPCSVAATHYSFMGATDPLQMEPHARELAGRLKADAVDAAVLPPV